LYNIFDGSGIRWTNSHGNLGINYFDAVMKLGELLGKIEKMVYELEVVTELYHTLVERPLFEIATQK
jgi:hypothetical protein